MDALYGTFVILVCVFTFGNAIIRENPLSDDFINLINSKQNYWKAGRNFPLNTSMKFIKKLMGTVIDEFTETLPKMKHDPDLIAHLPETFDPREKWNNCSSLNEIRDQGPCSSCWALGAVAAMTDRYCIYSNSTQQFHFSAEDLMCCEICGLGCMKGRHTAAWKYWKRVGLVSGGNFYSNQGCKPYRIPTSQKYISGDFMPYVEIFDITQCMTPCHWNYNIEYHEDKRRGKTVYSIAKDEEQIKAELFTNGPVEGVITVHSDFLNYKHGVYSQTEGSILGQHAVKILGWGKENGHKYWLVANSWNQEWGDNGFFKILRGVNHCGIEDEIVAGEPIIR